MQKDERKNLIDAARLDDLKGPIGFRNLAFDVLTLSQLVRGSWATVGGKTALVLADLDRAEMLGDRLITAVGLREQGPAVAAEASQSRHRAFTLFVWAYDHARRAVGFLRWIEEDADSIAPSLYAGRSTGKRKSSADPQPAVPTTPASPVVPAVPVVSPVTGAGNNGAVA